MATFHLTDKSGAEYEVEAPDEHAAVAALGQIGGGGGQQATPQATPAEPKSTLQTIREAIHAPTRALENGLFMGLGDRARALMTTGLAGGSGYGENLRTEQAQTEQFAKDHPIAAPVIEGVGGVAAPLGVVGAAAKGATLGAKTLYGAGAGGVIGGVQGALGSRDYTDLSQVAKDAGVGGGAGFVLGGALPATAKVIGAGYNAAANAVRGRAEGLSRGASRQLVDAVSADGPAAVQQRLKELGPDAMLVDAGPALLGKGQGASLNSDEGRSVLQNTLTARNASTNQRIASDVDRALGPAEDPQTVTNAIREHRSAVDSVNYPAALNNAPPVDTVPILRQLDALIPKSVGMEKKALQNMRGMLTIEQQPIRQVAPERNPVSSTADEIRQKYGDGAAAAYERQNQPKAQSLLEFITSKGGLGPDAELQAIGAHSHTVNVDGVGRRKLVKQGGLPLDYAREAAQEAGYLRGGANATSTPAEFLDAIDAELRGQKRYPEGFEGYQTKGEASAISEREQHELDRHMQGFEEDLAAAGHGQIGADVKKSAIHLMANQGMDADTAVEQAVRQLDNGFPGDRIKAPLPVSAPTAARPLQTDASVLHKVKQELDNVIQYDAPGLGVPAAALTRQQGALKQMRGALNQALEDQVPGYAQANKVSAALARRGDAVDLGTQYLGNGKTTASPGRFSDEFSRLQPGEQIAFAKGSRGNIDRVLGTKANDLQALRSELQGEGGWNTAKIAAVHGQNAADQLVNSVDRNLAFRGTFNKVVENSQTAQRQAAAAAMKPTPASETALINPNMSLTGLAATAGKKAVIHTINALARTDPTRSFGEVARVLTKQGPQRDRALQAVIDAINARQQNVATAPIHGNLGAVALAMLEHGALRNGPMRRQER